MKFSIVVMDPPFSFGDKLTMSNTARGADSNYSTLSVDDICLLPIKDLVDPSGAILALWVPSSMLSDGLRIMKALSFEQKQTYCWVKCKKETSLVETLRNASVRYVLDNLLGFGMGRLWRQTHEICLIGTSNNGVYKKLQNRSRRSVCLAENKGHSSKPENLQDDLDLMFPDGNRLEIFGRRSRKGWKVIGNQSPETIGQDIRDSIQDLIKA